MSERPNSCSPESTSPPPASLAPVPVLPGSGAFDLVALESATRRDPANGRAWFDLGCALNRSGRPRDALVALECALTLAPDQVDALCEQGVALLTLRSLDAAADTFEEVLAEHPVHVEALFCLANVKYHQGRFIEAAALWRQASGLSDDPVDALENLATTLQRLRRRDEEREVWHEILRRQPDHPLALHQIAALGETAAPPRAADPYVARLFDAFAPEFDATLAAIGYRGPELLAGQVRELVGEPRAALDILDAGCGTGLCGAALRPWARRLTGVDLSGGMLARARERRVYDELLQAELTSHLASQHSALDLVAFGDVLTYFGALTPVFSAALGALRPGGWLFCSLEAQASPASPAGYQLEPHGRYSHSADYVRHVCADTGAVLRKLDTGVLRSEAGQPVACLLLAAQKNLAGA